MRDILQYEEDYLSYGAYFRIDGEWFDPIKRARKRHWSRIVDHVKVAKNRGSHDGMWGKPKRVGLYPPGKRRDAYVEGYEMYFRR